jgi:hypothetical protein
MFRGPKLKILCYFSHVKRLVAKVWEYKSIMLLHLVIRSLNMTHIHPRLKRPEEIENIYIYIMFTGAQGYKSWRHNLWEDEDYGGTFWEGN